MWLGLERLLPSASANQPHARLRQSEIVTTSGDKSETFYVTLEPPETPRIISSNQLQCRACLLDKGVALGMARKHHERKTVQPRLSQASERIQA